MPVAHVTFFFCSATSGWVEQLYRTDASLEASLSAAKALAQARFGVLGGGVNLYQVRASMVGAPRDSISVSIFGTPQPTPAMLDRETAEIRLTVGGGGLYRRSYLLGGLPRGALVLASGRWQFAPAWRARIQAWLSLLTGSGWQLQCWARESQRSPILSLTSSSAVETDWFGEPVNPEDVDVPATTVIAEVNDNIGAGQPNPLTGAEPTVRVGRVRWTSVGGAKIRPVNGEYPILFAGLGLVAWTGALPPSGDYLGGGYLQIRDRIYRGVSSADLVRLRVRKVGPVPQSAVVAKRSGPTAGAVVPGVVPPAGGGMGTGFPFFGPPQPLANFWPPPVPIVVRTLNNARELAQYVFEGYDVDPLTGLNYQIRIAPIVNYPHTWLATMSGLDRPLEESTNLPNAIDAGIGHANSYLGYFLDAVLATVPYGDRVVLAGHSLGGLNAQLIANAPAYFSRHATYALICYGAFWNSPPRQGVRSVFWMEPNDIIRQVTWLSGPGRAYEGLPLVNVTPSAPGLGFTQQHNDYPFTPYLNDWNPDGSIRNSFQDRPWHLGATLRFHAKLTPP